MGRSPKEIRRPALRVEQDREHAVFLFALTGDQLMQVAGVSHVARDGGGRLVGYQRPEVRRHVRNIVDYLDGDDVLFPNAIILAMSPATRFRTKSRAGRGTGLEMGTLSIPVTNGSDRPAAWVVDGQQRLMALSRSRRRDLLVPVSAFVADDVTLQREQFVRINSAKPLARSLITELLPEMDAALPQKLASRRLPSQLCDLLNRDAASPFYGLIRRPSMPRGAKRTAVVNDSAVIQMLEQSLNSPSGCLFACRNVAAGSSDAPMMMKLLTIYWSAVRDVFPGAWGLSPSQSRLMHGAGLRAMGKVMDRVMSAIDPTNPRAPRAARKELERLSPVCRWTKGSWAELGDLPWNGIQNTPTSVRMLSDYLVRTYLKATAA